MTNYRNYDTMLQVAKSVGFIHCNTLIWMKGNLTPNSQSYMNGYEMIIQLRKGKSIPINHLGASNIMDIPNIIGKVNHPCEKPIELYSKFILQSSKENEIIFDPFAGAGTCVLSSMENNRRCVCSEIDPKYYNRMVERVKEEFE